MSGLAQFKKFLKTNLTHVFEIKGVFNGTLIDAYNLDKLKAEKADGSGRAKMPVMMKILEMFRSRRVEWWEHYQGRGSAWNMIQRSYTQLQIDKHNIPCSIIPFVKEIEKSQLMLCGDSDLVFCSSCYEMRIENASLKRQVEELQVRKASDADEASAAAEVAAEAAAAVAAEVAVEAIPEACILREWFDAHFHRRGKGHGYPRNRLRREVSVFLTEKYGYRAEISCNSSIWKWFVQNVVQDNRCQKYRAFRIWRKDI